MQRDACRGERLKERMGGRRRRIREKERKLRLFMEREGGATQMTQRLPGGPFLHWATGELTAFAPAKREMMSYLVCSLHQP
jgi:hypothetical protein